MRRLANSYKSCLLDPAIESQVVPNQIQRSGFQNRLHQLVKQHLSPITLIGLRRVPTPIDKKHTVIQLTDREQVRHFFQCLLRFFFVYLRFFTDSVDDRCRRINFRFGAGMGHLAKPIVPAGWDTSENKPWAWGSPSWLIQQLTLHRSATLSHRKKQTFLPLPEGPSRPPVPDRPAHTVRYAPKPNR